MRVYLTDTTNNCEVCVVYCVSIVLCSHYGVVQRSAYRQKKLFFWLDFHALLCSSANQSKKFATKFHKTRKSCPSAACAYFNVILLKKLKDLNFSDLQQNNIL